jgi:transporter family-2 protein
MANVAGWSWPATASTDAKTSMNPCSVKRPPKRSEANAQHILLPSALAVLTGGSIVVQQVLNANLPVALNSAAWSGFMSYFLGVVCMAVLALALRDPVPAASVAVRIPWWSWSGGLFGAIFIGLAIFLVPQLGAATFIALLVAGQMLASVAFDHFGWMGSPNARSICRAWSAPFS